MKRDSTGKYKDVAGLVLAGGLARRMGGVDKGLIEIYGRTMCEVTVDLLRPQVAEVLISANRNYNSYESLGCETVKDEMEGFLGPLAGLASAMKKTSLPWVITVPCDCPFLSFRYVETMAKAATDGVEIVVAHDGDRSQPTFMAVQSKLRSDLTSFLESGGRKIDLWFIRHSYVMADCSELSDNFVNVNTPEERDAAESRMKSNENNRA